MAQRHRFARIAVAVVAAVALLPTLGTEPVGAVPPSPDRPVLCQAPINFTLDDVGYVSETTVRTYGVRTPGPYWSAVAVRGSAGYFDAGILLHDPAACPLAESRRPGYGTIDWVAFDTNSGRLPLGTFPARIVRDPADMEYGMYTFHFRPGDQTLLTSIPTTEQFVGDGSGGANPWLVEIRDVYLSAGVDYSFTVTGGIGAVYVVGSQTSVPATWAKNASTADAGVELPAPPNIVVSRTIIMPFRPLRSGWYGVVFVRYALAGPAVTVRVQQVV